MKILDAIKKALVLSNKKDKRVWVSYALMRGSPTHVLKNGSIMKASEALSVDGIPIVRYGDSSPADSNNSGANRTNGIPPQGVAE